MRSNIVVEGVLPNPVTELIPGLAARVERFCQYSLSGVGASESEC